MKWLSLLLLLPMTLTAQNKCMFLCHTEGDVEVCTKLCSEADAVKFIREASQQWCDAHTDQTGMAAYESLCGPSYIEPPSLPPSIEEARPHFPWDPPTPVNAAVKEEFWALSTLSTLAVVGDAETSARVYAKCAGCYEVNSWLYGRRPGRARLYGEMLPIQAATIYVAYQLQKRCRRGVWCGVLWRAPLLTSLAIHAYPLPRNIGLLR